MLEKIKKILIEELEIYDVDKIQNDLENVEKELKILKESFDSKNKLIEQFEKQKKLKIEISYYSFMERNFTKRKEYIKYKKEAEKFNKDEYETLGNEVIIIEEKIKKLEEEKKELEEKKQQAEKNNQRKEYILKAKNLKDLGLTFNDAIKLFKENNIEFILTEKDKKALNNSSDLNNPKNLILIHKTNYIPKDNKILSTYKNGGVKSIPLKILDKDTAYKIPRTRNTIHFCVNGEIVSHFEGNFDNRKYAIIVPFNNVTDYNTRMKSFREEDTFFDGEVDIKGGYILCPKDEVEKISELNPNVNVIGYEGEFVDEYANAFIRLLGYKSNDISPQMGEQPNYIYNVNNYKFKTGTHADSYESKRDETTSLYYRIFNFIDVLIEYKNNDAFNKDDFDFYDMIYNLFSQNKYAEQWRKPRFIASLSEFSICAKKVDDYKKLYLRDYMTGNRNYKQNDSSLLYFFETLENDYGIMLSEQLKLLLKRFLDSNDTFNLDELDIKDEKLKEVIIKLTTEKSIKDNNDLIDLLFLSEICTQILNNNFNIGSSTKVK